MWGHLETSFRSSLQSQRLSLNLHTPWYRDDSKPAVEMQLHERTAMTQKGGGGRKLEIRRSPSASARVEHCGSVAC